MRKFFRLPFNILVFGFALSLLSTLSFAQHYTQTNLVSNTGAAPTTDPNLQNAWGLVAAPAALGGAGSPWWVANNAGGTSTLYSITVTPATATTPGSAKANIIPINGNGIVTTPGAPSLQGAGSATGIMFNGSPTDFILPSGRASIFIFVSEDGTIQGWAGGAAATIVVDHSQVPNAVNGAVYKGATIAEIDGKKFILAANFRSGRVDVFDNTFKQVRVSEEAFEDDAIPRGFAPFNIQGVGPNIYVTYARQDAARHDPVGGKGFGFVDVFDSRGRLQQRLQPGPWMNAPWGVVWATPGFGEFSNTILVGQFRGGTIAAFNPATGRFLGNVLNADGTNVTIDGLWALRFGNDGASGPASVLFFTAGPNGEKDGLLGILTPAAAELSEADEQ
jgi:uncharacterized protein (TIGR03118 family)